MLELENLVLYTSINNQPFQCKSTAPFYWRLLKGFQLDNISGSPLVVNGQLIFFFQKPCSNNSSYHALIYCISGPTHIHRVKSALATGSLWEPLPGRRVHQQSACAHTGDTAVQVKETLVMWSHLHFFFTSLVREKTKTYAQTLTCTHRHYSIWAGMSNISTWRNHSELTIANI